MPRIQVPGSTLSEVRLSDALVFRGIDKQVDDELCFFGTGSASPVVGNQAQVQLLNGLGSLIEILIDVIYISSTTGQEVLLVFDNAITGISSTDDVNKKAGGAASVGLIRQQTAPLPAGARGWRQAIIVNETFTYKPRRPIMLPADNGLRVAAVAANTDIRVSFDWREH